MNLSVKETRRLRLNESELRLFRTSKVDSPDETDAWCNTLLIRGDFKVCLSFKFSFFKTSKVDSPDETDAWCNTLLIRGG